MTAESAHPAVAVVIPLYNQAAFLPEAVASVFAQTYPVHECVIVDDGSTEPETDAVLSDMQRQGCRVIRQANGGLSAARNAGVRSTTTDYFIPLDADDRLRPRFVESLVPRMHELCPRAFVYCDVQYFGSRHGTWCATDFDPRRLLLNNLCTATAVIRRDIFEQVGSYRETLNEGYEDWDLWLRFAAAGWEGKRVAEPLFEYRQHERSMRTDAEAKHQHLVRELISLQPEQFAIGLGLNTQPQTPPVDEVFAEWQAAVRVDAIMSAGSWHSLQRFGFTPTCSASTTPRQQLQTLESSGAYRFLSGMKKTPLSRWFSRQKWGQAAETDPFQ